MVATRVPLLEREREIAALRDGWRAARAGRGSAWLICAEAGGGKTRLAAEAVQECGGRSLWGAAEPVTPPEPFFAISHALPDFAPLPERRASVVRALDLIERESGDGPLILVFDDL